MPTKKARGILGLFYISRLPVSTLPWAHRHPPGGQGADEYTPTNIEGRAMHPSIQQRSEGLAALRVRASIATSALFALIGKEQPVQEIRYQVINKGKGAYHVVERSTGKVMGMCFTWKAAINRAQVLEARADGKKINIEGWSQ